MPAKGTGRLDRERIARLMRTKLTNWQIAERVGSTEKYISSLRREIGREAESK